MQMQAHVPLQGSWQNACVTLNPAEFGGGIYPVSTPFCSLQLVCGFCEGRKKAVLTLLKGGQGKTVLFL